MANTNSPNGFRAVANAYGAPYSGALSTYKIPSGYATSVFPGDVVKFLTTGYVAKAAAGDQFRGVAVGFYWIGTDGRPNTQRYWPASTVTLGAADVTVEVVDDPNVLFEAQFGNSASVPAFADQGATFNLYDAGGNTSFATSGEGVDYTTLNTTAIQFRFVRFVPKADNDTASANSRGIFAPALHDYRVNTGI